MEIRCSVTAATRAVVTTFLAGAVLGGAAGCSLSSAPTSDSVPQHATANDQTHPTNWRGRIIGGISNSASPRR